MPQKTSAIGSLRQDLSLIGPDPHNWDGYNLTNLEGRLVPEDAEPLGPVVVLAAHYDSRDRPNETLIQT